MSLAPAGAGTPQPADPSRTLAPDVDALTVDPYKSEPSPRSLSLAFTGADIATLTTVGVASIAAGIILRRAGSVSPSPRQ
jgi:hypothetical protein